MAELAGILVGNYFLLECVAREGMVETYCTRPTTRGGVDVILRLFRPEFPDATSFREHFAEEVEKVWRCHHDHIQPLLEFGTGDELLYCATLAPEGETLAQLLERYPERYLPIPFAVRVITQLCSALQYAHERGIVHGNIQPSSILLDDEEHVLLTHFGMKRAYQEGEAFVSQLREGNAAYVAPEQALGMIQEASDIYALGVLLFRLLGGFLPYDDDLGEIAIQHANESMPALRTIRADVSEELELVVRTALAKTPGERFASPAILAQALQSALEPRNPQVVSSAPERRIAVHARRTHVSWSRVSSFFMLLVLLTGLIGASFFVFSLPAHMYDLRTISFLNPGHAGDAVATATKIAAKARSTPTGTTTTTGLTPISGSYPPVSTTSTIAVSPTPTVNGTVSGTPAATPPATPAPLPPNCATGTLSIDGSQSFGPLLQQVGSDYQNHCPNFTLALNESGSRIGLNALQQRHVDVASSDVTARSSRNLVDHPIAALLYAIVVNPDVQISGLSSATLQAIYQGSITNWSQVGGPDETITVYQRSATDTVTTIFRSFVLNGATEHVRGMRLKKDWVQAVAMTPGAISYVPLVEAEASNVAVLAIDGAQPGTESLRQGSYPFWSVEHLYTRGNGTSQFQAYLPFLNSTKEASMFAQFGALPVGMMPQDVLATHLPGPEI